MRPGQKHVDHATGVVIGETAEIGNGVVMLHGVTLGGTGKERGDRHPKIGDGVIIGAGAQILGNIQIGARAKIGAGSTVVTNVPEDATVVGVAAREVRRNSVPRTPKQRATSESPW
ncbi:MAG: serine O-acetyltransferase [Pirellulales bacterium]